MSSEGTGPFKCPKCGATTWGALEYCGECGMYLYKECPKCGNRWRYMFERPFCPDCGAKVAQPGKVASGKVPWAGK